MRRILVSYWPFLMLAAIFAFNAWSRLEGEKEENRNTANDPPSGRQIRWHIRHIREDLRLIAALLSAIALLVAAILARLNPTGFIRRWEAESTVGGFPSPQLATV